MNFFYIWEFNVFVFGFPLIVLFYLYYFFSPADFRWLHCPPQSGRCQASLVSTSFSSSKSPDPTTELTMRRRAAAEL